MKYLVTMLAFVCQLSFAHVYTKSLDTSSVNVPSSFSSAAGSKVVVDKATINKILVDNRQATNLWMDCTKGSTATVPSDDTAAFPIAGDSKIIIDDLAGLISDTCYLRGDSTVSTGTIIISVFYRR